ncbi:hypothetical protein MO973_19310 [Paenibacillus sp. TRM 82003]|nr:hypothetical protein [Paenibacillus sp. TRM 82003]
MNLNTRPVFAALAAATLLTGCAAGDDGVRPYSTTPQAPINEPDRRMIDPNVLMGVCCFAKEISASTRLRAGSAP